MIPQGITAYFHQLTSFKASLWAFMAGIMATMALPPFGVWPCLIPAFCILYLLVEQQASREAFWRGWWFGLGHFTSSLYWITVALGVEIERFYWLVPFALLGIPAVLAFYPALFAGAVAWFPLPVRAKWLLFAGLWPVFEYLRGTLFTGFPWNLIAYSWMKAPAMLQSASVTGAYGLSFLTVLFVTLPVLGRPESRAFIASVFAIWVLIGAAGQYRLNYAQDSLIPDVILRLVQPCIPQRLKHDAAFRQSNLNVYLALSTLPSKEKVTHILWPEAAVSSFLEYDQKAREILSAIIPENGQLLLGGPRFRKQAHQDITLWNSVIALDDKGHITATYDKSHLVPFGEYVPFRSFLPPVFKKITAGTIDFTKGEGLKTLHVYGLPPFSPLVCYESIFPGKVIPPSDSQARWMLNLTNDGWFGPTSGPYQHLAMTQMRAIEQGVPLVRVANNGISAVIDPYGRVKNSLALDQQGIIDARLPEALNTRTIYARFGNTIFWILEAGCLCAVIWMSLQRRRARRLSKENEQESR